MERRAGCATWREKKGQQAELLREERKKRGNRAAGREDGGCPRPGLLASGRDSQQGTRLSPLSWAGVRGDRRVVGSQLQGHPE